MKALKKISASLILMAPIVTYAGEMEKDIVAIAASNDSFSTLVTALKAADLVNTLQSSGPFTVFAPTNEAFAKLPEETLNALLKPENKAKLQSVLTYHVVSGSVDAKTAMTLEEATTVQGSNLSISVNGEKVMINDAQVIAADIRAKNGIIHVLDTVVLPTSDTPKVAVNDINEMMEKEPTASGYNLNSSWEAKQNFFMNTNL